MMTTSSTSPIAAVPHPTAQTVQILCVAADRRDAEFVRDELVKIAPDFNVDASCTLQDAIARVEDPLRYDAVLFDVHLQGGDTLSELSQLGELGGGPAVIMMGDEERCRTAFPAADAYLVKDQGYLARLPVVVQEVLSRRRPESVVSRQAPARTGAVSNASESRVRLVLETEPVCLTEMTSDGSLVAMNAAGLALVGAERRDQVLGGGFRRFVLSEDQQPFEELIQRVCAGQKDSLEYTLVRLDGSHRRVEMLAVPLRRGPNEGSAVLAVTLDSTELKSHRREVRESAAVANWPRLAQEWGVEREQLETVLRDSEARHEAQAKEWAKERDELAQVLQAAESRAEKLAQAHAKEWAGEWDQLSETLQAAESDAEHLAQAGGRGETVLRDIEVRHEVQAREWAKERDELTQALHAAESDAGHLAQAGGRGETVLRDIEARHEVQAREWAKERDELAQALRAAESRAERLAQTQSQVGTALRDSQAGHERQAKEWAKERDQLTEALRVAGRRAEDLVQAQGQGGAALRDSEARHEAGAKEWAKERDELAQALQAAESRAERLAQEWNAERQTLVASLRSAESRYEKSEQERARDRQQQDSPVSLADASYEELSAHGGMSEGSDESLGAVEPSRQRRGGLALVERDKIDAHLL